MAGKAILCPSTYIERIAKAIYRRRVEFAETDAAGMVHFSVFFRYLEEAEHAVWRGAGLDIFANHEERSWPRISASFDFKSPLRFQEEFEVHTEIGPVTRSTIRWVHVIMRGDLVIGTGAVTAVYVAKNRDGSMKSAEIASEVISRLRSALTASAS
ncbi:MAG TPA: thioesterase family protein [Vicinamibacterales bacterium]|nr:thioesterase family protein [Vicinamibacterales bacterium]